MDNNYENLAGINWYEPIVRTKYGETDPIITEIINVTCEVFRLNKTVVEEDFRKFIVASLNGPPGNPARLIFLQMIFDVTAELVGEASSQRWQN